MAVPTLAVLFALAGAIFLRTPDDRLIANLIWLAGLLVLGTPVVWRTIRHAAGGHFATDIVASLAIASSFLLAQPLAGLIVVLMQTGGEALERYAEGRASEAVRRLEEDAPRQAHRIVRGLIEDVPASAIVPDNLLLVRPGEMFPCDGTVVSGTSHVDTSRLTGEPVPARAVSGTALMSGTLNLEGALEVRATATSQASQYARIVEMVRSASASKAPLQRLADRYAVWFTPVVLLVCAVAWILSGDPTRVLAILVVATPCPLILATPVAIIGGINRAAARQIIMKTGGALEQLSAVRVAVFDKTGTLTVGRPEVSDVVSVEPFTPPDILRLAGALEQHSSHALARSVVEAAMRQHEFLPTPTDVVEDPGSGISGHVEGRSVSVGGRDYVAGRIGTRIDVDTVAAFNRVGLHAHVAIDGSPAGVIEFADQVRPSAAAVVSDLRSLGLRRVVLLSGDHAPNVNTVARAVGIDEAVGDLRPGEKLERVGELSAVEGPVMMVGDGTNDAPALSRAAVGVALVGHGGGVTADAADVLILNDDLSRLAEAMSISARTMRIARQSIRIGLALSGIAMIAASAGLIAPVAGALLQEGIDVAVILNALRASVPARHGKTALRQLRRPFPDRNREGFPTAPGTAPLHLWSGSNPGIGP